MRSNGESPAHALAKALIAGAARSAGLEASTEVTAPGGQRADVFIVGGARPLAVEVQLSSETHGQLRARTARWAADGVDCLWVVGPKCSPAAAAAGVQAVPLRPAGDTVELPPMDAVGEGIVVSLSRAVVAYIEGSLRRQLPDREVAEVVVFANECWRCRQRSAVWAARRCEVCRRCGQRAGGSYLVDPAESVVPAADVAATVSSLAAAAGLQVSAIRKRDSKAAGRRYLSHGCPGCDALFGAAYLFEDFAEALYGDATLATVDIALAGRPSGGEHWCLPAAR